MVNDTSIIAGLILFFIGMGVLLPYINQAYSDTATSFDPDIYDGIDSELTLPESCANSTGFFDDVACQAQQGTSVIGILISILSIFFWTFGAIPLFLDLLLFVPLRIILYFLVYRAIRSGSG